MTPAALSARPLGRCHPGLPSADELLASAAFIAACQDESGAIAWEMAGETAGKIDAWDHVECAMALDICGQSARARAAYRWLAEQQRADGTWPRQWQLVADGDIRVADPVAETNMCAYLAVGLWLHVQPEVGTDARDSARVTARIPSRVPSRVSIDATAFVASLWPTVSAALDAVVDAQLPFGGIAWAVQDGKAADEALLAGSSSIHHALRCGARLADHLGRPRPDWELAADVLADALRTREAEFADKRRFSMDWYYPVLGGALTGPARCSRLADRWDDFVVPGLGIRCVDDHPWVTGAETCELALALTRLGRRRRAAGLLADMQHLRDETGAYHTGYVYPDAVRWPIERSSWTAAAMLLAIDALTPGSRSSAVFTA